MFSEMLLPEFAKDSLHHSCVVPFKLFLNEFRQCYVWSFIVGYVR